MLNPEAFFTNVELPDTSVSSAALAGYVLILLVGLVVDGVVFLRTREGGTRWPRRARHLLRRRVTGRNLLAVMTVVFSLYLLVTGVLVVTGLSKKLCESTQFIVYSFTFHWAVLFCTAIFLSLHNVRWRAAFGLRLSRVRADAGRGLVAYLGMMPIVFLYMLLYNMLLQTLGHEIEMQDVAKALSADGPGFTRYYLLFMALILAPVAEEIVFRGLLLPLMARKLGLSRSILIVSVLFAAVHPHLPALVPLFVVSIFLCVGYAYTNSLAVPIVMHMMFNGVNILLLYCSGNGIH